MRIARQVAQMSDPVDLGQKREAEMRDDALREVKLVPTLKPCGVCYNCDEKIDDGEFCDADCRDDYERLQRRMAHPFAGN